MIYRPMYVDKVMAFVDSPFVKILTGIRRCGKSTILKMIIQKLKTGHNILKDQILHYNFDSLKYKDKQAMEVYKEIKSCLCTDKTTYLSLDEIQEIPDW